MEKYLVYFAECDECVTDVFKVDMEKDIFLERMTDDGNSFSDIETKEIIDGEHRSPSDHIRFYGGLYDNLEEAIKERDSQIREYYECLGEGED